jgi:transposase
MLIGVFHLSRRQVVQLLCDLFGVGISLGSVSNIEGRMSMLLKSGYEEAKRAADDALIKHTDGTGWRRAGSTLQLWTVATTAVTVFTIVANGAALTLKTLFGRIKGILISDRATAINFWNMKRHQICWAHLIRKFIAFSERDGPAGVIGKELVEYCEILFETYHAFVDGKISRRVFRERMAPVRLQFEAQLQKADVVGHAPAWPDGIAMSQVSVGSTVPLPQTVQSSGQLADDSPDVQEPSPQTAQSVSWRSAAPSQSLSMVS